MKIKTEIDSCYGSCPFFGTSMDGMYCNHPYWKDRDAYENMIITRYNSDNGNIPPKCPLLTENLTVKYVLKQNPNI